MSMGNAWDQDLTDSDGYVAGIDDEAEELGMGDPHIDPRVDEVTRRLGDSPLEGLEELGHGHVPNSQPGGRGHVKIGVMPAGMKRAFPDAASILITSLQGRQKMLVRR